MTQITNRKNKIFLRFFSVLVFVFVFFSFPHTSSADVLLPGNINTCGELAVPGTYTLTSDVSGGASTCFTVSSDNVIIDGWGHTISGTGSTAIDGRAYTSNVLTEGANGYTNLIVDDLNITGYTTGINISGNSDLTGNGVNNGYAGDSGDLAVYYSIVGSIVLNGGNSSSQPFGGLGGNMSFTGTDLDISNSTISALGGTGISGKNTDGGVDLNYTGTLNSTNLTLSTLSFLNNNTISYGVYPGGSFPISPGNISTCGTLYATTTSTFTLTQNISNISGTCFTLFGNDITIDGAGYSISSATTTNTSFAISAGSYSNFTLASTTVTDFSNLVTSSSSVTISGHNLDLSDQYIEVNTLTINYTGTLSKIGATVSDLSDLIVNGTSYGAQGAGMLFDWIPQASGLNSWYSITSSADGTKLAAIVTGGQIYTSTDSGVTWTARDSSRNWYSITSSADGTKLAAVVTGGQIYTSPDSGVTWIAQASVSGSWRSITSSADGTKLAAALRNGQIYTSNDSGITWTAQASGSRTWQSITSSADGKKLAAVVRIGQIYTSTDYGVTWTARESSRNWLSITSSADGTKLAATLYFGQIYTSNDSGVTWTAQASGSRNWTSITSSADGTKLAATDFAYNGKIYTSLDSGLTWTARGSSRAWYSITSSSDGTKLATVVWDNYIYTHEDEIKTLSVDILTPQASTYISWSPIVSWGTATSCYYSYDNFVSTSTANCASLGSDISNPGLGSHTLSVKGIDTNGVIVQKDISFTLSLGITITAPISGSTITSWNPVVNWDPASSGNITECYYSYDNFVSTSTANCLSIGSDILPPSNTGTSTLYLKVVDSDENISSPNVTFVYSLPSTWIAQVSGSRIWKSITSSTDGTKLVAGVYGGQIYTSTDSGVTWTAQASGSRSWESITSSADGTKLAAGVYGGQIYTSTDSGVTWTAQASGSRNWKSITSSSDGTKLAAVVYNGQIYTSSDSGVTWTAQASGSRYWYSITSSTDGTKLAAVVSGGQIYTSLDSGVTWTARDSSRDWRSVASSADGTKLVAGVHGGQIYTSNDSGVTWTAQASGSRYWYSITSSTDGTKLAATAYNSQIYISNDSGVTWIAQTSGSVNWQSITSSADGTKLAAVVYNGQIYTSNTSSVSIIIPSINSSLRAQTWSALVDWKSSISCYYSYNNWVSTSTVNCANNGNDIAHPLVAGTQTLYIKGIDALNNITNQFVSFYFEPWTVRISSGYWQSITSSADGTKLAAVSDQVYTSSNSGLTWTAQASGSRNWESITSSSDGTKLAAVVYNGQIYTSSDSGVTWVARESTRYWYSITSSSDGTKLAAVEYSGDIYTSTDSGVTWTAQASGSREWFSITSSADGTKLAAIVNFDQIYTSNDSGVTWTAQASGSRNWKSITSSSDGTKLAAVVYNGQIYTSSDSGVTWTAQASGSRNWVSITSSSDGTKLAATVSPGQIYTSTDSGVTWTAVDSSRYWTSITSSSDGTKLVAGISGGIYTSATTLIDIILPTPSSNVSLWSPSILWDRSVTCQYSYDNSIWSSASCSGTGSDISPPSTLGLTTLYIKATDFQNTISTTSVSFDYLTILYENSMSSCGTISTPGTYTLTQNITDVSGTCFVVNTNNVTINGGGYTVTAAGGNTSYAVTSGSYTGLTLSNINFSGFGQGDVSASQSITYSGTDIDLSNSTTTVSSLVISYTNSLTALNTYFSNLTSLIINNIDLGSFVAGLFTWSEQNISTCQTISSSGIYTLTADISDVSGTCFNITSDRVVIDGNNHTISGANGNTDYAIVATQTNANAHTGIGIKNLTLTGFGGGVDAHGADGVTGDVLGKNGGAVSLYNVTFPTNTVSINTKGGNAFYENNTTAQGGNAGNVKVTNSTVGTINVSGGDTVGDLLVGYDNGTVNGGSVGTVTNTNSTITLTLSNQGFGYIPGCMDNGFDSYDSAATYDDGSCTDIAIGSERDNPLGNTVTGPIDFYYYNNYGIVDGDANFYDHEINLTYYGGGNNYGTTTGHAYFDNQYYNNYNGEAGNNYGIVGDGAYFANTSSNYGTTTGTTTFEYGRNYGTINGNVDFTQGGLYEGYNYGTVNGDAIFYAGNTYEYYNEGIVTGTIYTIYGCTDPLAVNYDATSLYDDSTCYSYGLNADLPQGVTYTGDLVFSSLYGYFGTSNYGTVNGNAEFYTADGSTNYGTTTGDVTFYGYDTQGTGILIVDDSYSNNFVGTGVVGGTIYDEFGIEITQIIFAGNRSNDGYAIDPDIDVSFTENSYMDEGSVGDVTFDTTYYSSTVAQGGVFRFDDISWNGGTILGTAYGSDSNPITIFDFYNSTLNNGFIPVNARFNDSSENRGTIEGDMTINSEYYGPITTTSSLTLDDSAEWRGVVNGNIYASDGLTEITDFIFTDSSKNYTTINASTTLFQNSASNEGTINGDALFNSTIFRIGTVNGTATLGALSQTIQGVSNVINFVKNMVTRDILYITQGATLNISGLMTIIGLDVNNLLTLRSTSETTNANLNINGTSNLDFLRIKNISNSGLSQDVSTKIIFDDEGNVGFVFRASTTPPTREGITGSYTRPIRVQVSTSSPNVTPPTVPSSNPVLGSTVEKFFIKKVDAIVPKVFKKPAILDSFDFVKKPTKLLNTDKSSTTLLTQIAEPVNVIEVKQGDFWKWYYVLIAVLLLIILLTKVKSNNHFINFKNRIKNLFK